jgi:hypothetical protein
MFACYTGKVEDGEKLLAPVKAFGKPVGDIIQRRPYISQQSLLDATQPKGRRYYWKSEYLPRLSPELFDSAIENARRLASPHSSVMLFQLGGALAKHGNDHSAVGNRDAAFVLNITASWEKTDDDNANVEWARAAWRDMSGSPQVELTSTSSPRTRQASASRRRTAQTSRAWPRSRRSGTRRTCSG